MNSRGEGVGGCWPAFSKFPEMHFTDRSPGRRAPCAGYAVRAHAHLCVCTCVGVRVRTYGFPS